MPKEMTILRELFPECFWHTNCETEPKGNGIVKVSKDTREARCLSCGQRAYITEGQNCWAVPAIPNIEVIS